MTEYKNDKGMTRWFDSLPDPRKNYEDHLLRSGLMADDANTSFRLQKSILYEGSTFIATFSEKWPF